MQPDTQVEAVHLEDHLMLNFSTKPSCVVRGKYRNVPIWVTRGWTLQEMLASKCLRFYSKRWTLLEDAVDRDTDEGEDKISVSFVQVQSADRRSSRQPQLVSCIREND
ncbi:hypothetical protein JVT61DRAFT_1956 [Boletus reticuloceps]|uniref:Uncharacterized protein n=1 Tax=Boletus reticuloceps TaxID=495285 RepID=A0A8I3A1X0_9AGAM|nr:hypothetical protein JVT61DRAFT_1956 [Boletus reticuloceps]